MGERDRFPLQEKSKERFSRNFPIALKRDGLHVPTISNLYLLDKTEDPLHVTITLCPLYAPGTLSASQLLAEPANIAESRVAAKWETGLQVLESIVSAASGRPVEVLFTFADKGVIAQGIPEVSLLDHHYQVYQQVAQKEVKIPHRFQRYSELIPDAQYTILATAESFPLRRDIQKDVQSLVDRLHFSGIPFKEDLTRKDMTLLANLLQQNEGRIELVEGLVRQYGLFDNVTTKPNALNIFIERKTAGLLLKLTDLFQHSSYPRIDILC